MEDDSASSQSAPQLDPGSRDFLLQEFKALRDEILGSMERLIRIQLVGVTAIPLVIGAGEKYSLTAVIAAGPLVTIIFVLILLYEQSGVMRAGRYIREVIEPNLARPPVIGWETWLERDAVNRMPENYFAWASYAAFTIYYFGGIYFAHTAIAEEYSLAAAIAADLLYIAGLICGLVILMVNFAVNTTTLPSQRLSRLKGLFPAAWRSLSHRKL